MRYSKTYIPTLREAPQDAEAINQKLLFRAGFIRKKAPGIFILLPLGKMFYDKLLRVLFEQLGQFEFFLIHDNMKETTDDKNICAVSYLYDSIRPVAEEINSYKQLSIAFIRNINCEVSPIRPRLGLLKPKIYDAIQGICLYASEEQRKKNRDLIQRELLEFYKKCNIDVKITNSEDSIHFYEHKSGDRLLIKCPLCNKIALLEDYPCIKSNATQQNEPLDIERIYTPNVGTINELTDFLGISSKELVKTLLYKYKDKVFAALIRGDRELSERKLRRLINCNIEMADEVTVKEITGAKVGFAGPVGLRAVIIADNEVMGMKNFIVGANESDYHLSNVNVHRDFKPDFVGDIRCIEDSDEYCECGGKLEYSRGFVLSELRDIKKSEISDLGLSYLNEGGKPDHFEGFWFCTNMSLLIASIVEINNHDSGMKLPFDITPIEVSIVIINPKEEMQRKAAEDIYNKLIQMGYSVLLDDRNERPGVKFKDLELIGAPIGITVGKKIADNIVELKMRDMDVCDVGLLELYNVIKSKLAEYNRIRID